MRRFFGLLATGSLGFALTGIIGIAIIFALLYPQTIEDFEQAINRTQKNTIIYDRNEKPFRILKGIENRLVVPHKDINRFLKLSVLAAEDSRFFQHRGIDIFRLFGALWVNIKKGSYRQGASTVTQQLVKITLLNPERTLRRKFREMFIALAIEIRLAKDKILEHYLNTIYLGHGNYGVEQASLSYFGKHAAELTLLESTFLAGVIKKPEFYLRIPKTLDAHAKYFPQSALVQVLKRQEYILKQLQSLQWITPQEYAQALKHPFRVRLPSHPIESGDYFLERHEI